MMLKPSSLFGNGAILCRNKEIRLFGEAGDGVTIRARLENAEGTLLAEGNAKAENGRFLVTLPPQTVAIGCRLTFSDGNETRVSEDILIGDVYLAGGQSNMEMTLPGADEGLERMKSHEDPLLRYYNVPQKAFVGPEQREAAENAAWTAIRPGTGGDMSAVAYFFGQKAREETDVPVGIIDCYWGGTSITCWLDRETLESLEEGRRFLREYETVCGNKDLETFLKEESAWREVLDGWNREVAAFRIDHLDTPWEQVEENCGKCPWNPPAGPGSPYRPAGLADSMVKTVCPMALTAILFYQGETDAGATDQYGLLLETLVRTWRSWFRDEKVPFLNVQLPMWLEEGKTDSFTWPVIRKAQSEARKTIPAYDMICLLDQGEFNNLHPTRKRVVGERLWEAAKETVFGREARRSPRAGKVLFGVDSVEILTDQPVCFRETEALTEIAGENGKYVTAKAETDGNRIRLTAEGIGQATKARYAWTDFATAAFFGENGEPLEPFDFE